MSSPIQDQSRETKRPRLGEENIVTDEANSSAPLHVSNNVSSLRQLIQAELSTEDMENRSQESRHSSMSPASIHYREGLFLAPMVRIGSLPTRLLSLQYGADLVWSPEIVDRAIIGSDRVVNTRTGMVSFLKEGKQIFTTHPIERDRLIFQLGSSSPDWAYQAISHVTANNDVAGVDLNCGCPKPFSTIGGMGAQLLSTPDLLCSILRAMRKAAPKHVYVSCKIRLLPTKAATQALVRQIIRTNTIDALTVHCRTKDMRPREKALTSRLAEVQEVVEEETKGRLPLICNGDAWDASEAIRMMKATGVQAIMIARGAEANPSCFRPQGVMSVPEVIAPDWVRLALTFDNNYGNTKYCINSLAFKPSCSIVPNAKPLVGNAWSKLQLSEVRGKLSQAKSVDEIASVLGVESQMQRNKPVEEVLAPIQEAIRTRYNVDGRRKVGAELDSTVLFMSKTVCNSESELAGMESRQLSINVV